MGKFELERAKGEKGMTLVEVLAAIVILSIAFVGFIMIFPQMTNFNSKTGTKLTTMNIARQEIVEIQYAGFESPLEKDEIAAVIEDISSEPAAKRVVISADGPADNKITIKYTKEERYYEVDFYYQHDFYPEVKVSGNSYPYKVHLKVYANGKQSSETYAYIMITEG